MALIETTATEEEKGKMYRPFANHKPEDTPQNRALRALDLVAWSQRWCTLSDLHKDLSRKKWAKATMEQIREYVREHSGGLDIIEDARRKAFETIESTDPDEASRAYPITLVEAAKLLLELLPSPAEVKLSLLKQRFKPDQLRAFYLWHYEQLSMPVVAARMGWSERRTQSVIHAIAQVRADMGIK